MFEPKLNIFKAKTLNVVSQMEKYIYFYVSIACYIAVFKLCIIGLTCKVMKIMICQVKIQISYIQELLHGIYTLF